MPEEGQADEVVEEQRTEELAVQNDEPPESEEVVDAAGDTSLDYDELLGRKDPNNKRGGLSRKEAREQKAEEEVVESDELKEALERIKKLEAAQEENANTNIKTTAEKQFSNALAKAGVDVSTFNSQYKDVYLDNFDSLIADGLTPEKASSYALNMVLPKVEADEVEARSNGRMRATLPPTSQTQAKTAYKLTEIDKLASTNPDKYKELRMKHKKGEITIT